LSWDLLGGWAVCPLDDYNLAHPDLKGTWFALKTISARIHETIQHWQQDTDLASIRDPDAGATLPAEEQEACKQLWADVSPLLKRVREK
jgi:hypothetical protein